MALLDLYMQTTGDDRNAGTDSGSNPTEILGTVSTASGLTTFTASSGTPFASGVSAGSWVSLYNSGETISRFSGQVQSVTSSTVIVIYNQAATSPNNTALGTVASLTGTVACRVGGAWASFAITGTNGVMNSPSTSAALTGTQYQGLRINVKAGTYSYAAAITLPPGTAAKPIWWRGYYATIGDIDNCANISGTLVAPTGQTAAPTGATRPQIQWIGPNVVAFTASNQSLFENLEFSAQSPGTLTSQALLSIAASSTVRFHRCRVTNTQMSGYASMFATAAGVAITFTGCLLTCTSSLFGATATLTFIGCALRGTNKSNSNNIFSPNFGNVTAFSSIFDTLNTVSVAAGSNHCFANCSFYNCTTGFQITNITAPSTLLNCLFANCTTPISVTGNTSLLTIINPDYATNTNVPSGLWESVQRGAINEPINQSPFVSAGSPNYDYSLTSTALARQAGFPGQFEV